MIKKAFFSVLFFLSVYAHSQEWQQNLNQTQALFSIKKLGVKVVGVFSEANVKTNFNINDLENSYVKVKICVKSIATGKESRDRKILAKKYFFGDKYKFIHFTSSKIERTSKGDYFISGTLEIKGIAKEVRVPCEVIELGQKIILKSQFNINRKDFRLGPAEFGLSKKANIKLKFEGTT